MSHKYMSAFLLVLTAGTVVISTTDVEGGWFFRGHGFRATTNVRFHAAAPVVRPQLPSAPAGSAVTIPSNSLGPETGSAFMVFRNIKLPARIDAWTESSVTVTLPPMKVRHPVRVAVDVVTPYGKLAFRKHLLITPSPDVSLHPVPPQLPLPTNPTLIEQNRLPAGN